MKKLLACVLAWVSLGGVLAGMVATGVSSASAQVPIHGCTEESIQHFYGFSVGSDYVYTQTPENQPTPSYFLSAQQGELNVVQFDTWARDDTPTYRVESILTPLPSYQSGDNYGWTGQQLRFSGMFWRHLILEGRVSGWHVWELDIGVEEDNTPYEPFCRFKFFVYFGYEQ